MNEQQIILALAELHLVMMLLAVLVGIGIASFIVWMYEIWKRDQ